MAEQAEGAEIAEAALVLPIFFMVLLGIYWFGMAFNTYATINRAAVAGARVAVAQTCSTCGNTAPLASTVVSTVTQVMQASSVNPTKIITYSRPPPLVQLAQQISAPTLTRMSPSAITSSFLRRRARALQHVV